MPQQKASVAAAILKPYLYAPAVTPTYSLIAPTITRCEVVGTRLFIDWTPAAQWVNGVNVIDRWEVYHNSSASLTSAITETRRPTTNHYEREFNYTAGTEVLVVPGFEWLGDPGNLNSCGWNTPGTAWIQSSSDKYAGSMSAYFTSISALTETLDSGFTQVQPGYGAVLSFWRKITARTGTSSLSVVVEWYSGAPDALVLARTDVIATLTGTDAAWTQSSSSVTSPSNATYVRMLITATVPSASTLSAYIDDCSIKTYPPIVDLNHYWAIRAIDKYGNYSAASNFVIPGRSGSTIGVSSTNHIAIDQESGIYSSNFVAGSAGFSIPLSGNAEFNNVTVRGTIYATLGDIADWDITASALYKLDSGTPSSSPNNGITLETVGGTNGKPVVRVYDGTTLNAALGNYASGKYGIYAIEGAIGTWDINSTYLAKDTGTDNTSAGLAPSDYPFYAGAIYANRATAPYRVTPAGAVTCSNITVTGGSVATLTLNDAIQPFTSDIVWSITDADTVAWAAGTIRVQDGGTYSISAGNTGNMSALTYIYLDVAVSTTVLQTTTTYSTAVGDGKILVALAQNGAAKATVKPISAFSIVNAEHISCTSLSAIVADLGSITAGTITGGTIRTAASPNPRVEMNTSFLAGYSDATTKQFYFSATDGKAYFSGGKGYLDSDGISLEAPTAYADARAFKFKQVSTNIKIVHFTGIDYATQATAEMEAVSTTIAKQAYAVVRSTSPTGYNSSSVLEATCGSAAARLSVQSLASGTRRAWLEGCSLEMGSGDIIWSTDNTYDIGASGATRPRDYFGGRDGYFAGGLNLGTATGAAAGAIKASAGALFGSYVNIGDSGVDGSFKEVLRFTYAGYPGQWMNSIYSSVNAGTSSKLKFSLCNGSGTSQVDVMTLSSNPSAAVTISGGQFALNGTLAAGSYLACIVGASGAARDILMVCQSGFSNGFTVQYNGSAMVYNFDSGDLTCTGKVRSNTAFNLNGTDGVGATGGTTYTFNTGSVSGMVKTITLRGGIVTAITTET